MEIYNKALEAQKKSEHLQERRQRLSALLHSEARQYETELAQQKRHQSGHHRIPLEELKSVNYELKRREEDNQRREREMKLYHQWRMKQPSIREVSVICGMSVVCLTKDLGLWLRHCATSREVPGSIPGDVTGDFFRGTPTEPCALRSTQPLKVSTRDFSWGKGGRCLWLMTYHPCHAECQDNPGP